jgi:hypothetical protein
MTWSLKNKRGTIAGGPAGGEKGNQEGDGGC